MPWSRGEGGANRFYPRVSGQHFKYMPREMIDICDGVRPQRVAGVAPRTRPPRHYRKPSYARCARPGAGPCL